MALFGSKKVKSDTPATANGSAALKNVQTPKPVAENTKSSDAKTHKSGLYSAVIVHPLLTEKSNIQSSFNQYAFCVSRQATKNEIRLAFKEIYHLSPEKIRIIPMRGKKVRTGRNTSGYLKHWKKAVITVPTGSKIDVYES